MNLILHQLRLYPAAALCDSFCCTANRIRGDSPMSISELLGTLDARDIVVTVFWSTIKKTDFKGAAGKIQTLNVGSQSLPEYYNL